MMSAPVATVIESDGRRALVRVESAACPRCIAGNGCGAGLLAGGRAARTLRANVGETPVRPGQTVTLTMGGRSLLRGSLYLYGMPLFGLLAGTTLAALLRPGSDAHALLAAALGLAAGGLLGGQLTRRDGCLRSVTPTIAGISSSAAPQRTR